MRGLQGVNADVSMRQAELDLIAKDVLLGIERARGRRGGVNRRHEMDVIEPLAEPSNTANPLNLSDLVVSEVARWRSGAVSGQIRSDRHVSMLHCAIPIYLTINGIASYITWTTLLPHSDREWHLSSEDASSNDTHYHGSIRRTLGGAFG